MSIKKYLLDHRLLLMFSTLVLAITSVIILLDPNLQIDLSNLLYLLVMLATLFLLYIVIDYRRKRAFYLELKETAESGLMLQPTQDHNNEEKFTLQLLKFQKEAFVQELESLKNEQKEWHEYMTTWVHEIKTPISVSKMIFETEQGSESLEEEMGKIEHLVDQALYYTRASDFSKDYFIQEMNVEDIIKEAIKGHRKLFLSKKIKLLLDLSPMEVLTDKKGLLFIVNQLLSNSLKYTFAGGEISIQIKANEKKVIIRDQGIGIPTEDLPRIFEKGFTGKNGRQFAASTGIGLYLSRKIAGKLGHQLSIQSKEGSYTEASIYFSKNTDLLKQEFNRFAR
jgi:signal transduction histidine kinase